MTVRNEIIGIGSYLPDNILSNDELSSRLDTSDEWIIQRTGIKQRHIAKDGETTADLAYEAALDAIRHAGIEANEIDLIVLASATPDETFPATATTVQSRLGLEHGSAFDIQAVCSGFVYGLSVVDSMMKNGQANTALLIGAETFSRILDWEDRSTCVLFGDGAGAVVMRRSENETANGSGPGVYSSHLHSDGRFHDFLYVDGGPSSTKTVGHLRMQGREVFKHAVSKLSSVVYEALEANDLTPSDIDWIVPHQANRRIIEGTAKKLNFPLERVVVTVDQHANTSAASIPLAFNVAVKDGRIQKGDLVLIEAMGGGFTWGSAIIRY